MTPDPAARVPLTPLTPVAFHILLALAAGERHGYAIMRATDLDAGTVYRAIKRLCATGLVVASDERTTLENDDERRRYYGLTPWGRAVAQAETRRLARLVAYARATLHRDGAATLATLDTSDTPGNIDTPCIAYGQEDS